MRGTRKAMVPTLINSGGLGTGDEALWGSAERQQPSSTGLWLAVLLSSSYSLNVPESGADRFRSLCGHPAGLHRWSFLQAPRRLRRQGRGLWQTLSRTQWLGPDLAWQTRWSERFCRWCPVGWTIAAAGAWPTTDRVADVPVGALIRWGWAVGAWAGSAMAPLWRAVGSGVVNRARWWTARTTRFVVFAADAVLGTARRRSRPLGPSGNGMIRTGTALGDRTAVSRGRGRSHGPW